MQGKGFQGSGAGTGSSSSSNYRVENVTDVDTPYYATPQDGLIIFKTTTAARLYLPETAPEGSSIFVKAMANVSSSSPVTIYPQGAGSTIDGGSSFVLSFSHSAVQLVSTGSGWIIL